MPRRNKTTEAIANSLLEPLVMFCAENRGAKAEVHRRFCKKLGRDVDPATVFAWLRESEAHRVEPVFGAGWLLLQVWEEMRKEAA